mmetsp:Transcript_26231/g.60316  ORF Transcript_26231/g.60316 Transcript_26231/m.60316 type:complete len:198 (-) Transcript_26231:110-703(-)
MLLNEETNDNPLKKLSVLELGTGSGLVSIACSMDPREQYGPIIATDYEPVALELARYAYERLNGYREGARNLSFELFDICDMSSPLPPADIVVAADVMYEPTTGAATAKRVVEALCRGSRVIVGDSPGRAGRPAFLKELRKHPGLESVDFVNTSGSKCIGERHELICGKESTSVRRDEHDDNGSLDIAVLDLLPQHV